MRLTPPDITVKTTKEDINTLIEYANGIEFVRNTNPILNELLKFNLQTALEKLYKHSFKLMHLRNDHETKVKFTQGERLVFSVIFSVSPIPTSIKYIEFQIINRLQITN